METCFCWRVHSARPLVKLQRSSVFPQLHKANPHGAGGDQSYLPRLPRKPSNLTSMRPPLSHSCPYLYDQKRRGSVSSVCSQKPGDRHHKQVIAKDRVCLRASIFVLGVPVKTHAVRPLCPDVSGLVISERPEGRRRGQEVQRHGDHDLPGGAPRATRSGARPGRAEGAAAGQRRGEHLCLQRHGHTGRYNSYKRSMIK